MKKKHGSKFINKRKWHYKDEYYTPKNIFRKKPREYYKEKTTIELPEHLKEKLERIQNQPKKRLVPEEYVFECDAHTIDNFSSFIKYIIPDRRMGNDHYIYLVKKKPNNLSFEGNIRIGLKNYKNVLDIIFESIENETL